MGVKSRLLARKHMLRDGFKVCMMCFKTVKKVFKCVLRYRLCPRLLGKFLGFMAIGISFKAFIPFGIFECQEHSSMAINPFVPRLGGTPTLQGLGKPNFSPID